MTTAAPPREFLHPITPPEPGTAVLACQCGRMLSLADLRWAPKVLVAVIPPIVCADCAQNRGW